MSEFRLGEVAALAGVSVDTARRWADGGRLATRRTAGGHRVVDGADLARFLAESSGPADGATAGPGAATQSARNRFAGIVTRVVKDAVMAQVEVQAGPHRVVSLLSAEAVEQLGLEPGVRATAVVKATNVVIEVPRA